MQVIIHGRVRVYEPQGAYQLYVDSITAAGAGDLHARYEALRAKLAAEGLFDERRKRPIPRWPRRIGVVTSPVGVVWRDIANVLRRRYPLVELVLSASSVQGDAAAPAIVRALQRLYDHPGLDVVILARGGGSLEDLWSFNDERVVRAVVSAPVPIIVGRRTRVGHDARRLRRRPARPDAERGGRARDAGRHRSCRRSSTASATGPVPRSSARRHRDAASSTRRHARWRDWRPTSGRRGSAPPTCSIAARGR